MAELSAEIPERVEFGAQVELLMKDSSPNHRLVEEVKVSQARKEV